MKELEILVLFLVSVNCCSKLLMQINTSEKRGVAHRFARGEYQPELNEDDPRASGMISPLDFVSGSPEDYKARLVYYPDNDVKFVKKNYRFMTISRRVEVLESWHRLVKQLDKKIIERRPFREQTMFEMMMLRERATFFDKDFHKSGRALDMILVDNRNEVKSKEMSGGLAQIAFNLAGFDWCTVRPDYTVHCSVGIYNKNKYDLFQYGCFPNGALIKVRKNNSVYNVPIESLELNQAVLTLSDSNQLIETKIIGFFHRDPKARLSLMITVHFYDVGFPYDKHQLTATPEHLIFSNGKEVFFKELQVGDRLRLFSNRTGVIFSIERTLANGFHAPLTEDGSLIVQNVHVSCYALVKLDHVSKKLIKSFYKLILVFTDYEGMKSCIYNIFSWFSYI